VLSGCIGFKGTPKGKQLTAHAVQVSFKGCAGSSQGCSDQGDTQSGGVRILAAIRVPKGTDGPTAIRPTGIDERLKPDPSYKHELVTKAPTPDGTTWLAYSSKSFDWQGDPQTARAVVKLGLPNHPGKAFKYRPVLGLISTGADDEPVQCGTDVFVENDATSTTCIDAPDTPAEVETSLKIKLD
jgi:hypothetical protein